MTAYPKVTRRPKKQPAQWSYTHDDPNGLTSGVGSYSSRLEFYVPRCVSCHKRFDLARKKNI